MLWEILRISLQTLWGNKFRTLLTVLSVTIGAFSIVVMMSLAESGSLTLTKSVEEIGGARLVWWVPNPPREERERLIYAKGITREDLSALMGIPGVGTLTGMITFDRRAVYLTADNAPKLDVVGTLPQLLEGLNWKLSSGRSLTAADDTSYARVVVLTNGSAKKLFGTESPLHQSVMIFGKPYQVVGVLEERKLLAKIQLGFDWDESVFIPASTAEKREGMSMTGLILVAFTTDPARNTSVMNRGTGILLSRHNGVKDFQVINFGDILGGFFDFFKAVNLIVGLIAGISLLAGGIGVMNIMLVAVAERVREIGIRKALGASRMAILTQFLGEATVLATVGGLVGVISGLGVTAVAHVFVAHWSNFWVSHYSWMGIALSLGVTAGIGLFFGAIPAWNAARLEIVECLRR